MKAKPVNEEQMVHLVRNSLLVAGQEMGAQGDHWPVINDTIHKVMKDWEDLKIERNVDAELKVHLYAQLKEMEAGLLECSAELRALLEPQVAQLREVCDAYFANLDPNAVVADDNNLPEHIKRMKAIFDTLEDDDEK